MTHIYCISLFILQQISVGHYAFTWDGICAMVLSYTLLFHGEVLSNLWNVIRKRVNKVSSLCRVNRVISLSEILIHPLQSAKMRVFLWIENPNGAEGPQVGSRVESKCLCSNDFRQNEQLKNFQVQELSCERCHREICWEGRKFKMVS